jgi:hypothetical protein
LPSSFIMLSFAITLYITLISICCAPRHYFYYGKHCTGCIVCATFRAQHSHTMGRVALPLVKELASPPTAILFKVSSSV